MGKMTSSLRQFSLSIAIFSLFLTFFAFGPSASQAEAACRFITNPPQVWSVYYDDIPGTKPPGNPNDMGWTDVFIVPNSSVSTCNDINVRNVVGVYSGLAGCFHARVAFYPSGGGYVPQTSWKEVCTTPVAVATDVLTGTRYRLEYTTHVHPSNFANQYWNFQIFD